MAPRQRPLPPGGGSPEWFPVQSIKHFLFFYIKLFSIHTCLADAQREGQDPDRDRDPDRDQDQVRRTEMRNNFIASSSLLRHIVREG